MRERLTSKRDRTRYCMHCQDAHSILSKMKQLIQSTYVCCQRLDMFSTKKCLTYLNIFLNVFQILRCSICSLTFSSSHFPLQPPTPDAPDSFATRVELADVLREGLPEPATAEEFGDTRRVCLEVIQT